MRPSRALPLALALLALAVPSAPAASDGVSSSCVEDAGITPRVGRGLPACAGLAKAVSIAAGHHSTCLVLAGGDVDCYGMSTFGQSRDYVGGDAVAAGVGANYACALLQSGNVTCWGGDGDWDRDGDGEDGRLDGYAGGDAVKLEVGEHAACVVTSVRELRCWGRLLPALSADRLGGDVLDISIGTLHRCLVLVDGTTLCDGVYDSKGRPPPSPYPGDDAVAVASGGSHTCWLLATASVVCDGGYSYQGGAAIGRPTRDVVALAAGYFQTCYVLATGDAVCEGPGLYGETVGRSTTDAVGVAAGGLHTCVLLAGGGADCFGYGAYGQAADYLPLGLHEEAPQF